MRLFGSKGSPFTRKVRVFAAEAGLADRIAFTAFSAGVELRSGAAARSPIAKVPILQRDDGSYLIDSPVICEYLDSLTDGPHLFPSAGPDRWKALRQQALGDGLCECIIGAFREYFRPEECRSQAVVDRQVDRAGQALDLLESEVGSLQGPIHIGVVACAIAVGHCRFRLETGELRPHPAFDIAGRRPNLAAWFEAFSVRPSMLATLPAK